MPLTIQPHGSNTAHSGAAAASRDPSGPIVIALVNNMPDAALESTAAQFARLLRAAGASLSVELRLCFLPEVSRGPEGRAQLSSGYWPISTIMDSGVDALIVTGMEPKAPRLCDEPYWRRFEELVAWAESHTVSSIWSCLAAHAAVQILDGIERRRLDEKRFGVFAHRIVSTHPLMAGVRAPLAIPHSRWNEVPVEELRDAGYTIVSSSPETGADIFVKQGRSFLLFFQGHPEYEETTLLREYRRDVGRFLRGEQPRYPALPQGYFSAEAARQLSEFRARAVAAPAAEMLASFPINSVSSGRESGWAAAAARIYRNWLSLIAAARIPGRAVASGGA